MTKRHETRGGGVALVVLAALFWGLSGGVGGVLMASGWDPFVVSFYRGAIGLLFVLGWLSLRPRRSGLASGRLWFWAVVAGIGVAGNFSFYFLSIAHGSVAVAATLMYCAPVFVYMVSFLCGLESQTAAKWVAIAVVMAGIGLLTQIHDVGSGGVTWPGVAAGLLAGLSYAIFIFGFKNAGRHGSPQAILAIAFAVVCLVLVWPGEAGQFAAVPRSAEWPLFAGLGIFGAGLSFLFYIAGLNRTPSTVASVVAMVEPVTASLFGVIVLNQVLAGPQVLGMALILITVTTLSMHSKSAGAPTMKNPNHGEKTKQRT